MNWSNLANTPFNDLRTAVLKWRIPFLLGVFDIRRRYIRSKLGQFWLVLSTAIQVTVLATIWSVLFKQPFKEYLPFIAASIIIWNFFSATVTEGVNSFINSSHFIQEINLPKISYVFATIIRNLIVFLHNAVLLIPIILFLPLNDNHKIFLPLFGLILSIIFLTGIILFVSVIGLRYRDIPSLINVFMQIMFYLTPVLWKPNLVPPSIYKFIELNPFTLFLSIIRDPLIGMNVPGWYWIACSIIAVTTFVSGLYFFSHHKKKLAYWV